MQRSVDHIITLIQQIKPDNYGDCVDQLNQALADFDSVTGRELAVPAMLTLIESYPEADMGSPGPLVHEIENIQGYEYRLEESLIREPAPLTCWMANRIVNACDGIIRQHWLRVLHQVANNPNAHDLARAEARKFLLYQTKREAEF